MVFAIETVIGSVLDRASVEQVLPPHSQIKAWFGNLVRSPHRDGELIMHRELKCFGQIEVPASRQRAIVCFGYDPGGGSVKNTKMRVGREIAREPANGKGFKLAIRFGACFKTGSESYIFVIGKDANDRDK